MVPAPLSFWYEDGMSQAPIYIGLDLSFTNCAGVSLAGDQILISTKPKDFDHRVARVDHLADKIAGWTTALFRGEGSLVAIEGYAYGRLQGRELLGELGGAVRGRLYEMGIPFVEVPPTALKKFVTGKGTAEKSLMLKEVFRRWQYDVADDNLADAYGLARVAEAYQAEGGKGKLSEMTLFQPRR